MAITGAPGGGKSTLLEELARRGHAVSEEVARPILQAPGGMELRENDPLGFAIAMLEAELVAFEQSAQRDLTFFDRGFPDIAGFLQLEGLPIPDALDRAGRELRYADTIFRAPAWQAIYRGDAERIQSWKEALASDEAVTQAWRRYGYNVIDLPLVAPEERADFMLALL